MRYGGLVHVLSVDIIYRLVLELNTKAILSTESPREYVETIYYFSLSFQA